MRELDTTEIQIATSFKTFLIIIWSAYSLLPSITEIPIHMIIAQSHLQSKGSIIMWLVYCGSSCISFYLHIKCNLSSLTIFPWNCFVSSIIQCNLKNRILLGVTSKKKSIFKDIIQIKVDHPPSYLFLTNYFWQIWIR